jgi:hypothetical protein
MPPYPGLAGSKIPTNNDIPLSLPVGARVFLFGTRINAALPSGDDNIAYEEVPAGTASIPICLAVTRGDAAPMLCVEINFDSAPGVFEIDLQEADTAADAFYSLPLAAAYTVNQVNAATFIWRVDLSPTGGKFFRVYLKTLTNDADLIVKATRLA